MGTARRKIVKAAGQEPDEFELTVAQALFDLEISNSDLKNQLREIHITAAKERDVGANKKSVVIFVPVPLLKNVQNIQPKRRILHKPSRGAKRGSQMRPVSRTLTAVHDAILDDLVYPTEIVDKRQRIKIDGTKVLRVYLDSKHKSNLEYKLETFSSVYRNITGKDVNFEFATAE